MIPDTPDTEPVRRPERARRRGVAWAPLAAIAALIASSTLVMTSTSAAFNGATSNSSNGWSAATVTLTDDDGGSSMFTAPAMVPDDVIERCIRVDYTGSSFDLDPVTLHAAVTDTGLATHLDMVIDEGTGGTFSDCAGFSASANLFTGTLATLGTHGSHATGLGGYTPSSGDTSRTYRIRATLGADTPNSAQATGAGATLTWELHSA